MRCRGRGGTARTASPARLLSDGARSSVPCRSIHPDLARSHRALLGLFAAEVREHDPALATRLSGPLHELATLAAH